MNMPLRMLPETTFCWMRVWNIGLSDCTDPMPRKFGMAMVPVGSVPMKLLVMAPVPQKSVGGRSRSETPLPRKRLMVRLAIDDMHAPSSMRPSPSTVPPPVISMGGPSGLATPEKAVWVAPSTRRVYAWTGGSGDFRRIVFHGRSLVSLMLNCNAHGTYVA